MENPILWPVNCGIIGGSKTDIKTSYSQRSSTKTSDNSLFYLLIADGIQSLDVKHMYMYFVILSFNSIDSK